MPYLMKGNTGRSAARLGVLQYPVFVEPKADEIRVHVSADMVADAVTYHVVRG